MNFSNIDYKLYLIGINNQNNNFNNLIYVMIIMTNKNYFKKFNIK